MLDLQYTLPADRTEWFAKGTVDGHYFEVPGTFNEDGSLDEAATVARIKRDMLMRIVHTRRYEQLRDTDCALRGLHDAVWVNGELIREDHTLYHAEAAEPLAMLKEAFPEGYDFESAMTNVLGCYDGYRPPYKNPSVSWYEFSYPTEELLDRYKVDRSQYRSILDWYGLKFDLLTKSVILKVVCMDVEGEKPPFPENCFIFYATTHHEDGAVDDMVDCYVWTPWEIMREYCDAHGLAHPADDETCQKIVQWGIVFNKKTLELTTVKGYYEYGDTSPA
jgi:hypothetical protein